MNLPTLLLNRWFQIGLLCALLWGAWERGNRYEHSRDLWRTASEAQEAAYISAQAAAKLAQEAANAKAALDYQEAKANADEQAKALSDDYQRRLADYISRMRAQDDRSSPIGPTAYPQDQAAGGAEEADPQAGLVGISEGDLGLLVQAVADIETARAWAAQLVKDGRAE